MLKTRLLTAALLLGLAVPGFAQKSTKSAAAAPKVVTTASGLQYVDEVVGTGAIPAVGQMATVNCTGRLVDSTVFWSTTDPKFNYNKPLDFAVGKGQMIKGFDEGVQTMHVGGRRKLIIPADLGYGAKGRPPVIPANATLVFTIDLLGVKAAVAK